MHRGQGRTTRIITANGALDLTGLPGTVGSEILPAASCARSLLLLLLLAGSRAVVDDLRMA